MVKHSKIPRISWKNRRRIRYGNIEYPAKIQNTNYTVHLGKIGDSFIWKISYFVESISNTYIFCRLMHLGGHCKAMAAYQNNGLLS